MKTKADKDNKTKNFIDQGSIHKTGKEDYSKGFEKCSSRDLC